SMYANDPRRSEEARAQVEAAPLQVKIRYLSEFMSSDPSDYTNLKVPLLALVPGFNEKLLAEPRNGWDKTAFQDSWEALSNHPRVRRVTIPDARALILDDQPTLADEAIKNFLENIGRFDVAHVGRP